MRCRPMVVLPLPAEPWTAIRPDDGWVISSNWRGSISAAMAGRWRSGRRVPAVVEPQLAAHARGGSCGGGSVGGARRAAGHDDRALPSRAICRRACRVATSRHAPVRRSRENVPCGDGDPAQLGVDDGDGAARHHLALDQPVAQPLLVGVALLVAIEEARHGRVAPVDDLHAAARFDEAARADQDVAALAALLQAQVPEVGRLAIDGRRVALAALAATAPRSGASARGSSPGPRAWPRPGRRAARSARWRRRPGCAPCAAPRRRACAARRRGAAAPRGRSEGAGRLAPGPLPRRGRRRRNRSSGVAQDRSA